MIDGWNQRYEEILRRFGYKKSLDEQAAVILDSIIKPIDDSEIFSIISAKTVFVIGSGPSLKRSIKTLKKFKKIPKIVADSAVKPIYENGIKPDIVVTDLDGDIPTLRRLGKKETVFVVHAHGDNISNLPLSLYFSRCIGSTQTKEIGNMKNFGGFTDGDRAVFLAKHYGAKKIILFGMDFDGPIGDYSSTKDSELKVKREKLKVGKSLLEWLVKKNPDNYYTTSGYIEGFKNIEISKLKDIIIT